MRNLLNELVTLEIINEKSSIEVKILWQQHGNL